MKAKQYKKLRDRAISRERQQANDREATRIVLEQLDPARAAEELRSLAEEIASEE